MARKVRKQVYLTPEQDRLLKRRARELGVSESDLIRRSIQEAEHVIQGTSFNETAWQEALRFMMERQKIQVPQTGRTWTREELYEDRLERFSR